MNLQYIMKEIQKNIMPRRNERMFGNIILGIVFDTHDEYYLELHSRGERNDRNGNEIEVCKFYFVDTSVSPYNRYGFILEREIDGQNAYLYGNTNPNYLYHGTYKRNPMQFIIDVCKFIVSIKNKQAYLQPKSTFCRLFESIQLPDNCSFTYNSRLKDSREIVFITLTIKGAESVNNTYYFSIDNDLANYTLNLRKESKPKKDIKQYAYPAKMSDQLQKIMNDMIEYANTQYTTTRTGTENIQHPVQLLHIIERLSKVL